SRTIARFPSLRRRKRRHQRLRRRRIRKGRRSRDRWRWRSWDVLENARLDWSVLKPLLESRRWICWCLEYRWRSTGVLSRRSSAWHVTRRNLLQEPCFLLDWFFVVSPIKFRSALNFRSILLHRLSIP